MKVQILSDIHVEFHRDRGRAFVERLDPRGVDVLVVAGDLGVAADGTLEEALTGLCARYRHVVFVAGNHELYGSGREEAHALLGALSDRHRNLHWLEEGVVAIDGQRFVGGTLWFPPQADGMDATWSRFLNDFRRIRDFDAWVHAVNRRTAAFLDAVVLPGDVVVTHHLPHASCVPPKWVAHPLTRFFVSPLPDTLVGRPALWAFGHGHDSYWGRLGACRLVANPFGYMGHEENPGYGRLVVDVATGEAVR